MTRAVYRFRGYTIRPDLRPEADPVTFEMRCTTCKEAGPTADQVEDRAQWAAQHLKANPGHLEYLEHIRRPYRFEPGAWQ